MIKKDLIDIQVFLVEPSTTQQHIIQLFLSELGITNVTLISSGTELFSLLKQKLPDLIISAMYLPDMTGAELVQNIRNDSDSYDMAFLLISSETNINYLEPIRQAGAIAILAKPFTMNELSIALTATLDYLNPQPVELEHLDIEDVTVLVVDDSPTSLKYITKILSDLGIDLITQAVNGKQAIDYINQQLFDLIVTDFNMPEMDGLELTNAIRAGSMQKSIPILMLTSEQNVSRLAAVKKAGVSATLDKPFNPASLKQLIQQLLS